MSWCLIRCMNYVLNRSFWLRTAAFSAFSFFLMRKVALGMFVLLISHLFRLTSVLSFKLCSWELLLTHLLHGFSSIRLGILRPRDSDSLILVHSWVITLVNVLRCSWALLRYWNDGAFPFLLVVSWPGRSAFATGVLMRSFALRILEVLALLFFSVVVADGTGALWRRLEWIF